VIVNTLRQIVIPILISAWIFSGLPQPVFAATLSTLRPTGDGTLEGITFSTGTTAWSLIDDDPDSPDTADYILQTSNADGTDSAFLDITDMPADFQSMDTLQVDVHVTNASEGNDTIVLTARVFQSDETTALTNSVTLSTDTDVSGLKTGTFTLQGNNNKTVWDAARIQFVWTYDRVQGADANSIRVNAAELDGTYTAAAAPTVTTDSTGNVSASAATLFGTLTSIGSGGTITRGFATSSSATMATDVSTTSQSGSFGTGSFSLPVLLASPDTTYYYRAFASNAGGTSYGVVRSFTTGNSTVTRKMRIFQGFKIKFINGKMILYQRQ
jgi:hypothetical protein